MLYLYYRFQINSSFIKQVFIKNLTWAKALEYINMKSLSPQRIYTLVSTELSKLWPMGSIQSSVCLFTSYELRIICTVLIYF